MVIPIPESWRKAVCRILQSTDKSLIDLKLTARHDWEAATNHAFFYELYNDLLDALSDPSVVGRKREMDEPGEAYDFKFIHYQDVEHKRPKEMYSKICLCPDKSSIIIYSAHIQQKGKEL